MSRLPHIPSQMALALDDAEGLDECVQRWDRASIPRGKARKTREGYLVVTGVPIARIGPQEYLNADGSTRTELRIPEEVFASDALASGERQPITILHPSQDGGAVNASNSRDLMRGAMSNLRADEAEKYVLADVTIHAEDAIDQVESGMRDLSVGYFFKPTPTRNGKFSRPGHALDGVEADLVQTRIRINHLALVPKGRANVGDPANAVRIRLDAAGNQPGLPGAEEPSAMPKSKLTLGKLTFDVSDDIGAAFDASLMIGDASFDVPEAVKAFVESIRSDMAKMRSGMIEGAEGPNAAQATIAQLRAELAASKAGEARADQRADHAEGGLAGLKATVAQLEKEKAAADAKPEPLTDAQRGDHFDLVMEVAQATGKPGRELVALDTDGLNRALVEHITGDSMDGKSAGYVEGVLAHAKLTASKAPTPNAAQKLAESKARTVAEAGTKQAKDEAPPSPLVTAVRNYEARLYGRDTEAKA